MKKLYIVMPVVNCLEMTREAFLSIQSKTHWTLILIDNASTDDTKNWAEAMHKAISTGNPSWDFIYIRNEERKSVAQSWNQGVKRAFEDPDADYVAILNNDIILHEKTLDHLIAYMDKTQYLIVTGDNAKDRMSVDVMKQMELPHEYTDFDLWPIEGWRAEGPDFSCFMIRRETIRVLGWFDENYIGSLS